MEKLIRGRLDVSTRGKEMTCYIFYLIPIFRHFHLFLRLEILPGRTQINPPALGVLGNGLNIVACVLMSKIRCGDVNGVIYFPLTLFSPIITYFNDFIFYWEEL